MSISHFNKHISRCCVWMVNSCSIFYCTRKYEKMLCILEFASNIFSFKKRVVHDEANIQLFRDLSKLKKMVYSRSLIQKTKYEISRVLYIELTERYKFLFTDFPEIVIVGGLNSECMFFFLKFLYVYKHGNSLDTESALQVHKTIVKEKNYKTTNVLYLGLAY